MAKNRYAIGVDLGGTKIDIALVDSKGHVIQRLRVPTEVKGGAPQVESQIIRAAKDLQNAASVSIVGLGIGVAGQIEPSTGTVIFAPNLDWHQVPLKQNLEEALDVPVIVTNDVRAATWGEWLHGAGRGSEDIICLFVGTGIGGGIVSGGRMLTGYSNTCGELGHVPVDLNGPRCTCGNYGCLEAIAGGWAIAKRARERVSADRVAGDFILNQAGNRLKNITAKVVGQAAQAGDPLAKQIMAEANRALIAGIAGFVNAFNPERVILGGGLIEGNPKLIRQIEQGVRKQALKAATASLQILPTQLHLDAGIIGAATLVLEQMGRTHK